MAAYPVTSSLAGPIDRYLKKLSHDFPHATVLASGFQIQRYRD